MALAPAVEVSGTFLREKRDQYNFAEKESGSVPSSAKQFV